MREDASKFVSAVAKTGVREASRIGKTLPYFADHHVAHQVSIGIIDLLKISTSSSRMEGGRAILAFLDAFLGL